MPRMCTVCNHPDRQAIEQALVSGKASRYVSKQFNLGHHNKIWRHATEHMLPELVKAQRQKNNQRAIDVADHLNRAALIARTVAARAISDDDRQSALGAAARLEKQAEIQAKIDGAIQESNTVNVLIASEWLSVRAVLLEALTPYPEARIAVAASLARLEASK